MSVPYKLLHLFFVSALVFSVAGVVLAQGETLETTGEDMQSLGDYEEPYIDPELVDVTIELPQNEWGDPYPEEEGGEVCFDYYTFQSVQVALGTDKATYQKGETVKLSGELINENNYPIVDGNVFARVTIKNDKYSTEGNYIVDEFFASEAVTIDANGETSVSSEWNIPEAERAGEYEIIYYFSVGKRFNLGGLPFTNDIKIGTASFTVENSEEDTGYITFDRSETEVNGLSYSHIGDWPTYGEGEEISITQPLTSTYTEDTEVTVVYDLYYWDSLRDEDRVDTKEETVIVPANVGTVLEYVIPDMDDSVYYLSMTAYTQDGQQTIVNVRVASNQAHPRLGYVALTQFPIQKGEEVTLFSCFHNTSNIGADGKTSIALYAEDGSELARADYEGAILPNMKVLTSKMLAEQDYEKVTLKAEMYDGNNTLLETYEVTYDCEAFGNCAPEQVEPQQVETKTDLNYLLIMLLVVVLLIGGILLLMIKLKRREKKKAPVENEADETINNDNTNI